MAGERRNWRVQVLSGVDHHPLFRMPEICLRAIEFARIEAGTPAIINKPLVLIPTEKHAVI